MSMLSRSPHTAFKAAPINDAVVLGRVLDVGLGAVAAGGGLGVPFAIGRFIFDGLGTAGHALFGGGAFGCGECCGVGREGFRKHAIDGVGPAAVMLHDFVGDVGHRELAFFVGFCR